MIGYTLLRNRTFFLGKVKKYFYFDTLIVDKKFRNKKISNLLMALNSHVIKKNNKISFLICLNQTIKFYCQFGWRVMSKEKFSISDHNSNKNGMYYNIQVLNKKKYIFFLHK